VLFGGEEQQKLRTTAFFNQSQKKLKQFLGETKYKEKSNAFVPIFFRGRNVC
jgi:hypothetical protein